MDAATAPVDDGRVPIPDLDAEPIRVVVADDHILLREGVARLLADAGLRIVGQTGDADGLIELVQAHRPDVAVVDIRMPPSHTTDGLVAALRIRDEYPAVGVLLLSQFVETHYAVQLLGKATGRVGYLLKERISHIDEFVDAVGRVGRGGTVVDPALVSRLLNRHRANDPLANLTDRERQVLGLMAEGRSNVAITKQLRLGAKTVETHVTNIFTKLDLLPTVDDHRRVLAVLAYLRASADSSKD